MTNAEQIEETTQSGLEVIDSLSFTIQRQSANCLEFVKHAVTVERERCARLAEVQAESLAAQGDHLGSAAVARVAQQIRRREEQFPARAVTMRGVAG